MANGSTKSRSQTERQDVRDRVRHSSTNRTRSGANGSSGPASPPGSNRSERAFSQGDHSGSHATTRRASASAARRGSNAGAPRKRSTTSEASKRSSSRAAPRQKSSSGRSGSSPRLGKASAPGVRGGSMKGRPNAIKQGLQSLSESVGDAGRRAVKPTVAGGAATAAIAGALALGKALRPKPRRVLRIPVRHSNVHLPHLKGSTLSVSFPVKKISQLAKMDLDTAANGIARAGQQIGRTGRHVGKVAGDIERVGQTAERVGLLLAK
jgi:hypothetical protein